MQIRILCGPHIALELNALWNKQNEGASSKYSGCTKDRRIRPGDSRFDMQTNEDGVMNHCHFD